MPDAGNHTSLSLCHCSHAGIRCYTCFGVERWSVFLLTRLADWSRTRQQLLSSVLSFLYSRVFAYCLQMSDCIIDILLPYVDSWSSVTMNVQHGSADVFVISKLRQSDLRISELN